MTALLSTSKKRESAKIDDLKGEKRSLPSVAKPPAETLYERELSALEANDDGPRPPGWNLSPKAVRTFILGSGGKALKHAWGGKTVSTVIEQKYYGDDPLIERCIVTLAGNRGLLLVGEPGTAKSMLSELLAAAISGESTNTVQGTAGTTEDQIKYSWNYALLISEGPSMDSLIPAPLHKGLREGKIIRFEEITRCPGEIQDALVSILSDKIMHVPELGGDDSVILARKGFNVIATANLRDRGVYEMSSALKRRFNFETVYPISDIALEKKLVLDQTKKHLSDLETNVQIKMDVIDLLVTTFRDLREGRTENGLIVQKPTTIMSTAEAVSVGVSAGLDATYFGSNTIQPEHVVKNLIGTVLKDDREDEKKLREYFEVVIKKRAQMNSRWKEFYRARKWLM